MNSHSLHNGTRKIVASGNVSSNTTWTLKNLKPGTYRWAVQSIDKGYAGSAFSPEGTFTVDAVTGIDVEKINCSIYPNPIFSEVIINTGTLNTATVEVTNIKGEVILNKQIYKSEIKFDLTKISPGVYFITIYSKNKKIIVQKVIKE